VEMIIMIYDNVSRQYGRQSDPPDHPNGNNHLKLLVPYLPFIFHLSATYLAFYYSISGR
jgi:hypothetical protein